MFHFATLVPHLIFTAFWCHVLNVFVKPPSLYIISALQWVLIVVIFNFKNSCIAHWFIIVMSFIEKKSKLNKQPLRLGS